jgi:PqqD family protein of HPr-rel-A system
LSQARAADARFRVAPHPDLRILRIEDETLVFNPRLWHTHLLNASAALILDCLDEPASAAEIAAGLAEASADPAAPPLSPEQIATALEELERLGIVEEQAGS